MRQVNVSSASRILIASLAIGPTAYAQLGTSSKLDAVEARFAEAFEREDFAEMIVHGVELSRLTPDDPHLDYMLALAYASQDDTENAIKRLNLCATKGYRNIGPSKKWKAFGAMQSDPQFKKALNIIRKTRKKAWEAFRAQAKNPKPLIIVPPNYTGDKIVPMLVVLHRYGGSAEEIAEIFREPAKRIGAILVAPTGPQKAKGGGRSWGNTFGWRHQREDVFVAVYSVLDAAEQVTRDYPVDLEKFLVAGFSQGADIAIWTIAQYGDKATGVLAIGPRDYELFERYRGSLRPNPPKFYLMAGENDERLADCLQIEDQVKGANMPAKVKALEGLGHEISKAQADAITEGLEYLMDR
ncbi:MAG: hypothetical protein IIC02_13455 [Planctomycetes bacterium]|nr:hypothetical protein [Planctomycetota bacterium]